MSSPSRHVIDPLICSYDAPGSRASPPQASSTKQVPPAPLPAATNLVPPQNPPGTGWTPLVSRTFNAEINSYNSTPSLKIFTSLYKQTGAQMGQSGPEDEYSGLSLTPFLTHNLNVLAHPNSAGHYSNNGAFTPFYDKSMHLTDFFMDLPIRTPLKLETITPSRFLLHHADLAVRQSAEPLLNVASLRKTLENGQKRPSIGHSALAGADKRDEEFGEEFVTPSKKKAAPKKNRTPARAAPESCLIRTPAHPVSSPSTVILSSAVKLPEKEDKENEPPSPTPVKDVEAKAEPVMGIFSEKKRASDEPRAARPKRPVSGTSRFQIVLTDVHTLMNSKTKKRKKSKRPPVAHDHSMNTSLTNTSLNTTNTSITNTSINNTSITNTSLSTNMTSVDHASFELMHGAVCTPNKFLLDHSFERRSPDVRMAPPKYGRPFYPFPEQPMMSTPQKYLHAGPGPYLPEVLPLSRDSMAFLYLHLQQMPENYEKR